jgi:hypothetical protein
MVAAEQPLILQRALGILKRTLRVHKLLQEVCDHPEQPDDREQSANPDEGKSPGHDLAMTSSSLRGGRTRPDPQTEQTLPIE